MSPIVQYIFIFVVAAIFFYIIARMVAKRMSNQDDKSVSSDPPFSDIPNQSQSNQLSSIQTLAGSGISNAVFNPKVDNSLRNYCIKSSYNSAYTGGYVNVNMVKYLLTRGCRFLDFEIYIKDGVPIIAYSEATSDPSYNHFTSSMPAISLQGVLSTIMSNAFTDTSPNPRDPLFIQLRIKTYLSSAYDQIASILQSTVKDRLYQGTVTPDTQLTDLVGKIVLVVDNITSPGYQNYTSCTDITGCVGLADLVNMDSGTSIVRIYNERDLMMQAFNPPDPDVYMMRIVFPNRGIFYGMSNPAFLYLMKNYGAQIVTQAFYLNDTNLTAYEDMFRNFKSAFVPISAVLAYNA